MLQEYGNLACQVDEKLNEALIKNNCDPHEYTIQVCNQFYLIYFLKRINFLWHQKQENCEMIVNWVCLSEM